MLTLKLISEETERVIKGLNKKHFLMPKKPSRKFSPSTFVVARHSKNWTVIFRKPRKWQQRLEV